MREAVEVATRAINGIDGRYLGNTEEIFTVVDSEFSLKKERLIFGQLLHAVPVIKELAKVWKALSPRTSAAG